MALLHEPTTVTLEANPRIVGTDRINRNGVTNVAKTEDSQAAFLAEQVRKQRDEIEALRAQLANASKPKALTVKMSEKGGFSVYGLNVRFPVSLYAGQWVRLAEFIPAVLDCIATNVDKCAVKDESERSSLAAKLESLLAEK